MNKILSSVLFFAALSAVNANAHVAVTPVTPDYVISGNLLGGNDAFQFDFELTEATQVRFETSSWATGGFDTRLTLFSGETGDVLVAFDDDGASGLLSRDSLLDSDTFLINGLLDVGVYSLKLTQSGNNWDENLAAFTSGGDANFGGRTSDFVINSNVAPVPLPAAVWLFGSGLIGFLWQSKRNHLSV
jgi:hypothetical protein